MRAKTGRANQVAAELGFKDVSWAIERGREAMEGFGRNGRFCAPFFPKRGQKGAADETDMGEKGRTRAAREQRIKNGVWEHEHEHEHEHSVASVAQHRTVSFIVLMACSHGKP